MLKTNINKLIKLSVIGEISSPIMKPSPYRITSEGEPVVLPTLGGITYNLRIGDLACGWEGDHTEPCVSIKNKEKDLLVSSGPSSALNVLSCIGNKAAIVSGKAEGKKGVVTGKHGGIEHVLIDFPPEILKKLVIGDKIQIQAFGTGLKLLGLPHIKVMNLDPGLLKKMNLKIEKGRLKVGVTHIVPAVLMGSGLGADQTYSGDYDIQLFDKTTIKKYGLGDLRLGDFVAISDTDHSYGRVFKKGAVSVGIIVHADCVSAGHGPGVTTIFTSSKVGAILPFIDSKANLANML